jgi:colicin import membrane protein
MSGHGRQFQQKQLSIFTQFAILPGSLPFQLSRIGIRVDQTQFELQLKVWKELAISKQMLMRTAAETLGLDANCSQEELKAALDACLQKLKDADGSIVAAKNQAQQSINEMEKKLLASQRAQSVAETETLNMRAAQEKAAPQLAAERATNAKEIQQLKNLVAEKDKLLKSINTALADTPDNVVKKMKALKKEKQDEADARRQLEISFGTLRKEKQDQDKELSELHTNATKLGTQYTELHVLATKLHEQLKPLVSDESQIPVVPELDSKLLESIEQTKTKPKNYLASVA